MSRPEAVDDVALRARLVSVLLDEPLAPGSLYLRTLICAHLACDEESDDEQLAIETLYTEQARIEGVDVKTLVDAIVLAGTEARG
jgi:hypothetical protein